LIFEEEDASVGTVVEVTVGVSSGWRVGVSVGVSVGGAKVAEGVSGRDVKLGVNVAVSKTDGVVVTLTIGRIVGISPIQAARIAPIAPIIATMIRVYVFFSVMLYS
jgi:hypothetical protein